MRQARVLLAKPGLDGHDRGIKVIAMALRDAGAEVIYLGLRRSPEEIVVAAEQEDADVIGVSILSGAHMAIASELLNCRHTHGMDRRPIALGGTIPERDRERLLQLGVDAVYSVGTSMETAVSELLRLAASREPGAKK